MVSTFLADVAPKVYEVLLIFPWNTKERKRLAVRYAFKDTAAKSETLLEETSIAARAGSKKLDCCHCQFDD